MNQQSAAELNQMDSKFDQLEAHFHKINQKLDKVLEDITDLKVGQAEIKGEIKALRDKTDSTEKRLGTVESKLPDISEKFGELKNWRQIAFIIIAAVVSLFVGRATKF